MTRKADELLMTFKGKALDQAFGSGITDDGSAEAQKALYDDVCKYVIGEDDPVTDGQSLEQNYANEVGNMFRAKQRKAAAKYFGQGEAHE